jgi:hypothetical protein
MGSARNMDRGALIFMPLLLSAAAGPFTKIAGDTHLGAFSFTKTQLDRQSLPMKRNLSRSHGRRAWVAALSLLLTLTGAAAGASAAEATDPGTETEESGTPAPEVAAPPTRPAPAATPEPASAEGSVVEPPQPPPPNTPPIPATVVSAGQAPAPATPAPYVEHLGPESFPGRLRGLYGGSLWLEPSFHGLQWPYMSHTGVGVSGSFWVNTGYESIKRNLIQLPNSAFYFQQGRGVLRVTPTYTADRFFVQGQAELVGNLCQTASVVNVSCNEGTFTTDDLWIRVGQWNRWDLKVGRFEGWEVYHLGMGMDPYTFERMGAGMFGVDSNTTPKLEAPTLYGVNFMHDRPAEGLAAGYVALHLYPSEHLRFELLGKLSTDNVLNDNSTGDVASTTLGGRPTAILDLGWLKFKIGGEYQKRTPITQGIMPGTPGGKIDAVAERDQRGASASLQFVFAPVVEFGVNAAIGSQLLKSGFGIKVPEGSFTTRSLGGFANIRFTDLLLFGVGVNWTTQTDDFLAANSTTNDFVSHLQGFGALQYLVSGQLFVKAVVGYARAYFQPSDATVQTWTNDMYSGRIQLMYLY